MVSTAQDRQSYISVAVTECEPHLTLSSRHLPSVLLSSPFTGLEYERRAVAAAIAMTKLPVILMEHSRAGDDHEAMDWTKGAVDRANILVVILGLRAGSYPFGKRSLVSPLTYFETEVRLGAKAQKLMLGYYLSLIHI